MSEATGPAPALRDVAVGAIEGLADMTSTRDAGAIVYARAGHPFARLTDQELDVRLEPLVATAALRTPDTKESPLGAAWVRFSPGSIDRYAADRVSAWIEHAWRHATD